MRTLSDLKRALTVGAEFEILNSSKGENVGQLRHVNRVNTQGFYTIRPDAPDSKETLANYGKGMYLDWCAAKFWRIKEDNIAALYNSAEEQTRDTLVIEFRVIKVGFIND